MCNFVKCPLKLVEVPFRIVAIETRETREGKLQTITFEARFTTKPIRGRVGDTVHFLRD